MSWSSESNCLSLSFRSSFFSCFKVLFLSLFNSLLCSLFCFDSLSTFSFFCFRDSSYTIRDDDWVLLNSFIATTSLAVSLKAFATLVQVVSGLSFSCFSTSSLVWRSLRYFWFISGSLSLFTSSLSDFLNCLLSFHHSRLIFALTSLWSVGVERLP